MASPPAMPPPLSINLMSSFGAVLVGSFLSSTLWGISTLQTFLYFMKYDTDSTYLKILVASLWAIDTVNEVLIIKSNFRVPILHWGLISGLDEQQLELMDHTVTEALVVLCVQLYFIWRIYIFSKRKWLFPALLVVLASWQVVGVIVYLAYGYGRALSELATPRQVNINISLRTAAAAVDISTTVGMVYLLSSKPSPEFQRSKRIINRLIVICINSGMVTAAAATATLILQIALPETLYFVIPELPLCSLYLSTFLANLNARRYVRHGAASVRGGNDGVVHSSSVILSSVPPLTGKGGGSWSGPDTSLSWLSRSGAGDSPITPTAGKMATPREFASGVAPKNDLELELGESDIGHENVCFR